MSHELFIVDGVRTPCCKWGTALTGTDAVELGRSAVAAVLARTGLKSALIHEVIFGCVGPPAEAANLARVIALRAGGGVNGNALVFQSMRRPKPQPIDTRLPRLRNATPKKPDERLTHDRKSAEGAVPRISRGRTFRLRNVHHD